MVSVGNLETRAERELAADRRNSSDLRVLVPAFSPTQVLLLPWHPVPSLTAMSVVLGESANELVWYREAGVVRPGNWSSPCTYLLAECAPQLGCRTFASSHDLRSYSLGHTATSMPYHLVQQRPRKSQATSSSDGQQGGLTATQLDSRCWSWWQQQHDAEDLHGRQQGSQRVSVCRGNECSEVWLEENQELRDGRGRCGSYWQARWGVPWRKHRQGKVFAARRRYLSAVSINTEVRHAITRLMAWALQLPSVGASIAT